MTTAQIHYTSNDLTIDLLKDIIGTQELTLAMQERIVERIVNIEQIQYLIAFQDKEEVPC